DTYPFADMLAQGRNVYGNPEQCIAAINATLQNYQFDVFSTTFNFGGLPHEEVKRSMRLFAKEVMPAFKDLTPPLLLDQGAPELAEALPQLSTDTWRLFPDGRMETTYRFRPNLTWHDGTPFSGEDYVFGWRVYATPELGLARTAPFDAIEEVVAPDSRTLLIKWKQPYPDAAHLAGRDRQFPALPRHLLQATFESESADSFSNLPYWTRE